MVTVIISCYWVPTHRGAKSGGELVTLFGSYSNDGLNDAIGVQHTEVPNQGAIWSPFLARVCEGTFLLVLYNCR